MEAVKNVVAQSQDSLKEKVSKLLEEQGRFSLDQYSRFLTMQYFLTQDVQKEFYCMAGNKIFRNRKNFRKYLTKFAEEEEPHYLVAGKDLEKLGREPGERPLDVILWKTFFEKEVLWRPFIRIGATCVLENIANTSNSEILSLIENTPELNESNTVFLRIHMHGPELPHGDEIFEELDKLKLSEEELNDLALGARFGKKIYLQLVDWIISGNE